MEQQKPILVLGSQSLTKRNALDRALKKLGLTDCVEVSHLKVKSSVRAQPEENAETVRGARHRASEALGHGSLHAIDLKPCLVVGIGVESGIRNVMDRGDWVWEDWAVVYLLTSNEEQFVEHSRALKLPTSEVSRARNSTSKDCTVGRILAEERGGPAHDPHFILTKGLESREDYLAEVLEKALEHVFKAPKAKMGEVEKPADAKTEFKIMKHHAVMVGTLRLDLPVMEIRAAADGKPGLSVAVFNPLGNWRVNEVAGVALAEKIPKDVEVLVMPDGKAQALLHVMGRQSNLQTMVARKEAKTYMGPTVSVEVQSITTARKQMLHLSESDAALLKGKKVAIVDDVVSTGGTLDAMRRLLALVGAEVVAVMAVFTEGDERKDVIALGHLPLFSSLVLTRCEYSGFFC